MQKHSLCYLLNTKRVLPFDCRSGFSESISHIGCRFSMNKDALWALLVVILLTSMAAMMLDRDDEQTTSEPDIQPEQQETDDTVQDEPIVEAPHDDGHLHPAPILSLISAEDDGSMISMSGYVIHGHPDQVLVDVFYLCLLYTSPSPRDAHESRMPSSA